MKVSLFVKAAKVDEIKLKLANNQSPDSIKHIQKELSIYEGRLKRQQIKVDDMKLLIESLQNETNESFLSNIMKRKSLMKDINKVEADLTNRAKDIVNENVNSSNNDSAEYNHNEEECEECSSSIKNQVNNNVPTDITLPRPPLSTGRMKTQLQVLKCRLALVNNRITNEDETLLTKEIKLENMLIDLKRNRKTLNNQLINVSRKIKVIGQSTEDTPVVHKAKLDFHENNLKELNSKMDTLNAEIQRIKNEMILLIKPKQLTGYESSRKSLQIRIKKFEDELARRSGSNDIDNINNSDNIEVAIDRDEISNTMAVNYDNIIGKKRPLEESCWLSNDIVSMYVAIKSEVNDSSSDSQQSITK